MARGCSAISTPRTAQSFIRRSKVADSGRFSSSLTAWVSRHGSRSSRSRPATFRYPLYSFAGDWVMYWRMLTGKIPL